MPIKIVAKKKNTKKSGVDGVAKTKDMQAIKAKKDLKYKQNPSYGEHYNKEANKTFPTSRPAKGAVEKVVQSVVRGITPTIAIQAAINKKNNKQYETNRAHKTEMLGNTKNPFKKVEKNYESRSGYKSAGGKMSKYYSKGGTVFTGR